MTRSHWAGWGYSTPLVSFSSLHMLFQSLFSFSSQASLSGAFGGESEFFCVEPGTRHSYASHRTSCDGDSKDGWGRFSCRLALDLCAHAYLQIYPVLRDSRLSQILEGLATVIASFIAAWFLPEGLATAPFFTDEEREFARKYLQLAFGKLME